MDKYLKRGNDGTGSSSKRRRVQWGEREPESVVAWNCNGLSVRLKSEDDAKAIEEFVVEHSPDVLFISEVRCAALSANPDAKKNDGGKRFRSKIGPADSGSVEKMLRSKALAGYESYFSLADWRYAGTAVLLKRSSICKPSIRYNVDEGAERTVHHEEGRVILLEWKSFALLHTYSPNNGWSLESFPRREAWDESITAFVKRRHTEGKPVIWCGDLNVAPLDIDLSHPAHYKRQKKLTKPNGKKLTPPPDEYIGQPGCTPMERKRFETLLDEGHLVDFYRKAAGSEQWTDLQGPYFSWRGGPGKNHARGMRIDHFVGSSTLAQRVTGCEILGKGSDRLGFLGSDHCPIKLTVCAESVITAKSVSNDGDDAAMGKENEQAEEEES